jgi:hypothetical protein
VYQPSCLDLKKALAQLFALRWVYVCVSAELFALQKKHQLGSLRWDEFTSMYQLSCCTVNWKKAPAKLLIERRHQPSCLRRAVCTERRKHQPSCFVLRWAYYSVRAELFAMKESPSWAVCAVMGLLQCTSRAVRTEGKITSRAVCTEMS